MIIEISELGNRDFTLSEINLSDNLLKQTRKVEVAQKRNTLIYILDGRIRIAIDGEEISFGANSIIYFPPVYMRKMFVEEQCTHYYRIDFALKIDGEVASFSDTAMKISGFSAPEFRAAATELNEICNCAFDSCCECVNCCLFVNLETFYNCCNCCVKNCNCFVCVN